MLVLSRKRGESFVITDSIWVTVIEVRGDKVKLGITAPRDVPVHRKEVYERSKQQAEAESKPAHPQETSVLPASEG